MNIIYIHAGISCQTVTNTSNPDVSNVRVNVSSYYVDGVATYYCMPRYELIGSSIRTCETNGKWSGNQPSCQREYKFCKTNTTPFNNECS